MSSICADIIAKADRLLARAAGGERAARLRMLLLHMDDVAALDEITALLE